MTVITRDAARILVVSGILILVFGVGFFLSRTQEIAAICGEMCTTGVCPHSEVPLIFLLSFIAGIIITLLGVFLWRRAPTPRIYKADTINLSEDERRVVEFLKERGGIAFQSDIVEVTGFSKSKVSRILDKLEVLDVVERRRRGMTNIVILKLV